MLIIQSTKPKTACGFSDGSFAIIMFIGQQIFCQVSSSYFILEILIHSKAYYLIVHLQNPSATLHCAGSKQELFVAFSSECRFYFRRKYF